MRKRLRTLREEVDWRKAQRASLVLEISEISKTIQVNKREIEELSKARVILREVAKNVQQRFKRFIEGIVTLALRAVFKRYRFKMKFSDKRKKPVCEFLVMDKGKELIPREEDVGVGAVDVAAFVLNIGILKVTRPKLRQMLYADEPSRNIGIGEEARRLARVIRRLSHKLKIQVIINTHDENLIEAGDRVFRFTHNGEHTENEVVVDRWEG